MVNANAISAVIVVKTDTNRYSTLSHPLKVKVKVWSHLHESDS